MTLIEGVGDEVLQFLVMTLLIGMTLAAWMSTNARPNRYRTLLVMRSHQPHPVTVSIRSGVTLTTSPGPESNLLESGPIIPLQEMDSIVDADMALFENNRLHFYRRVEQGNGTEESGEDRELREEVAPASHAQIQEMDSIVSAMEADMNTDAGPQEPPRPEPAIERAVGPAVKDDAQQTSDTASASPPDSAETEEHHETETEHEREKKKILIKLKYLNDTLQEVEGSLDESLQDFKWRHFARELARSRRVLLIHGGRVLSDERASLRALGLTHRAVVHALVQPPRSSVAAPAPAAAAGAGARGAAAPRRLWDLENILMTLVSVALTIVWFFRCEYSNMFTASASVALFGLTVFYSVAIFGLYLSDSFALDRRPNPAHPVTHNN